MCAAHLVLLEGCLITRCLTELNPIVTALEIRCEDTQPKDIELLGSRALQVDLSSMNSSGPISPKRLVLEQEKVQECSTVAGGLCPTCTGVL